MAITVTGLTVHTQTGAGTWQDYGSGGGSAANTDVFLSSTGSRARKISNGVKGFAFEVNASGTDLSNTVIAIRWATLAGVGALNTRANSGVVIRVEDTSGNQSDWAVDGNDTYGGGWRVSVIDTSVTETSNSGTAATLTAVQYVGIVWDETASVGGGDPNCYIDEILSFPNTGLTVANNTTSLFPDLQAWDDTGDYGLFETRSGVIFSKANFVLQPDATGISDTGRAFVFENPVYYDGTNVSACLSEIGLSCSDADSVLLTRCNISADPNSDITGTDSNREFDIASAGNFDLDTCTLSGFDGTNAVALGGTGNAIDGTTFVLCGKVTDTGAVIRDCFFREATDAAGAYEWTTSSDMEDCTFFSDGTGYGIDIQSAPTSPSTTTFTGIVGVGYGADNTANATVDNNTGHSVTIAATGGTSGITVDPTSSTTVENSVTITLSGLVANSTVYIRNTTDGVDLFKEVETTTTFSDTVNYTADKSLLIRVRNHSSSPYYKDFMTTGTLTVQGFSLTVNQELDE